MIGIRVDANEIVASGHILRCITIAKEIEKVGFPGILPVKIGHLRGIAVGIYTLGQRPAGIHHRPHQGKVTQIEAHLDQLIGRHLNG